MNQPSNASHFVLLAIVCLLGCRANHQHTRHHQIDAIAAASINRENQPIAQNTRCATIERAVGGLL